MGAALEIRYCLAAISHSVLILTLHAMQIAGLMARIITEWKFWTKNKVLAFKQLLRFLQV